MKFNEYLNEKIVDMFKLHNETFETYINPSSDEMKHIETWVRGLIDSAGNLYVISNMDRKGKQSIIHYNVIGFLKHKGFIKSSVESEYVLVQRDGATKNFYLGESYDFDITPEAHKIKLEKMLKKASTKNSSLKFKFEIIEN